MLENVFTAVTGVITEPTKASKTGGLIGKPVDLGKGMLGIVCKPVQGTIDLVTQSTRGSTNTPRTMYVGISKLTKKVPKKSSPHGHGALLHVHNPNEPGEGGHGSGVDPVDDLFIGEENGQYIYLSKKALKESIHNSQILSALLYESQRVLGKEGQEKMK